jgi:hypothetical protein
MLDPRIPMTGKSLEGGLRMGAMISDSIAGQRSRTALQDAQARINAGEDSNAVIQQLMAQDPAAAQQLMNLKSGSMQLNAQAQEMEVLKQKYGMQKLQSAAMPMLGAIMQDDPKVQDKLIDEASSVFKGQSDGIFESLQGIKNLQGVQRADALTGLVKTLRTAGIFPDDPSQMMQGGTALGQNLSLYDQAVASGDMERAELIKRNIDPYSGSFARGAGAGEARLGTERGLNDILSARKAGEVEAVEQTATGQANLKSAQLGAQKAETAVAEDETRKAKQIELSRQTATLAKEIANSPNLGSVTGLAAMTPTLNPESQDLIIKSQQLLALLTADNLKLMSGVLTDKDIEMLQTLSSGMKIDDKGIKGSEQAIRKRLVEIATNIEKTLAGKSGVAPAQQQAPATRNESDILKEYGL